MRTVLNLKVAATVNPAALGETLDLGDYANAAGTLPTMLKLSWAQQFLGGTWGSVKVQHSSDNTTFTDLWDLGNLTSANYRFFYIWNRYLAILHTYTQGANNYDKGARLQLAVDVYGLPCWRKVQVCRREHLVAIMPNLFLNGEQYPDQMEAAKREIEIALRGRGTDVDRLLTDGHATEPCIPGLEMAGAYKTLLFILADAKIVRSDDWHQTMEWLSNSYQGALDAGSASGLATYDATGDAAPERPGEEFRGRVRVRR